MQRLAHLVGRERQEVDLHVRRRQPRMVFKNAPEVPAAMVSGPCANAAYCRAVIILRHGMLTISLSVMLCVQRVTMRTCR